MGLDGVELVLAVEDAFQLTIPDEDAEGVRTPGDLVDCILRLVDPARSAACLEQRAFYRLRRGAQLAFGRRRSEVVPTARWEALLPAGSRRASWKALGAAAGLATMPSLTLFGKLPEDIATVGATARRVAAEHPSALKSDGEGWRRSVVEATVRHLVCSQLGIDRFEWRQSFVDDLGMV